MKCRMQFDACLEAGKVAKLSFRFAVKPLAEFAGVVRQNLRDIQVLAFLHGYVEALFPFPMCCDGFICVHFSEHLKQTMRTGQDYQQ
jgi:hypothetical protein